MIDLNILITPSNILFLTVLLGYFIGRIKISHISLGLSGILFVAIVFGMVIANTPLQNNIYYINDIQLKMKTFSTLGSAIFVSVIGINTGISLKSNVNKNIIALMIGCLMTVAGVLTAIVIGYASDKITRSTLLGILCGALTSTPALSAVCENENIVASEAVVGYSCAYLFGVILVVLMVNIISSKSNAKEYETVDICLNDKNSSFHIFILVCVVALLGNIVGSLEIPIIKFSLGNTGGILCVGTLVGCVVKKTNVETKRLNHAYEYIRNIGLSLFFAGTGISAGMEIIKPTFFLVSFGIIITCSSLITGFVLTKVVFLKINLKSSSILAGGLTSSPALGMLIENKKELSTTEFSFSYFGALLTLIIIVRLINL